ncbi:MAG: hypothetical protein M3Z08_18195 [Chloroflexota bacterium]|nr:hypothetical protein [Chloroflexota bacterium]
MSFSTSPQPGLTTSSGLLVFGGSFGPALAALELFTVWGKSYQGVGFLFFILETLAYSVIMTWYMNHTRFSVFMAILFHAAVGSGPLLFLVQLFPHLSQVIRGGIPADILFKYQVYSTLAWL